MDSAALSVALDTLPIPAWVARSDGSAEHLNTAFVAFCGKPARDLLGFGWWGVVAEEDRECVQLSWTESLRREVDYLHIHRYLDATQVPRYFMVQARPLRGEGGQIERWVGTSTPVEWMMSTAANVALDAARTRAFMQAVALGSIALTLDGTVAERQPAWEVLTGQTAAAALKDGWLAAFPASEHTAVRGLLQSVRETRHHCSLEVYITRPAWALDDSAPPGPSPVLMTVLPIGDEWGNINSLYAVFLPATSPGPRRAAAGAVQAP